MNATLVDRIVAEIEELLVDFCIFVIISSILRKEENVGKI